MTVTSGIGKAYFRDPRGCLNSPGASSFLSLPVTAACQVFRNENWEERKEKHGASLQPRPGLQQIPL